MKSCRTQRNGNSEYKLKNVIVLTGIHKPVANHYQAHASDQHKWRYNVRYFFQNRQESAGLNAVIVYTPGQQYYSLKLC